MEITEDIYIVTVEEFDPTWGCRFFDRKKFTDEKEAREYSDSFNKKDIRRVILDNYIPDNHLHARIEKV